MKSFLLPPTRASSLSSIIPIVLLVAGSLSGCGGSQLSIMAPPSISVSPAPAFVASGGQRQFTAIVTNTSSSAVTWQVNGMTGGNAAAGTISSDGLYIAPGSGAGITVTAVSQADSSLSASASVSILAPHAIAVRPTASSIAEFYDVATGNTFTPRGNNYVRLAAQTKADGTPIYTHSMFNVGLYDSTRVETALAAMQSSGYNTVRVFLNGCCANTIGNPAGGLSPAYIANIADFLSRAANHSIYVIIAGGYLSDLGGYFAQGCGQFADFNLLTLCPDGVTKTTRFFQDFVQGLVDHGARVDAVLGYELRSEFYYEWLLPPLSLTSGTVTTADGQTYDMSNDSSRQQMMDSGLIYWADHVRQGIISLDPTALVTFGAFDTSQGNTNYTRLYPPIASSTVDFVDLHSGGPLFGKSLAQIVQNFGFVGYQQQKPIVMGEYVAVIADVPLLSDAALGLQNWQISSCAYSYKGWVLWTWDLEAAEAVPGDEDWAALSGDGSINQALAPAVRPNPCQ